MTQSYWVSWSDKRGYYVVMHEQKVVAKVPNPDKVIEYLMLQYKINGEKPEVIAVSNPNLEEMIRKALMQVQNEQPNEV